MSDEPKPMSLGQVAFLAWWHADVRWSGWRPSWDHLPYLEAVSWEAAARAVLEAADAATPRPTTAASDDPLASETRLRSELEALATAYRDGADALTCEADAETASERIAHRAILAAYRRFVLELRTLLVKP